MKDVHEYSEKRKSNESISESYEFSKEAHFKNQSFSALFSPSSFCFTWSQCFLEGNHLKGSGTVNTDLTDVLPTM